VVEALALVVVAVIQPQVQMEVDKMAVLVALVHQTQ
jgi:hypothetical protein